MFVATWVLLYSNVPTAIFAYGMIDLVIFRCIQVKIFDFGLARIMPEDGCAHNDTFDMSGAGSPR